MNKRWYAFMTALVLIAGLAGGAVSGGFFAVLPARAQRVDRSSGTVSNRWEYCSITRAAVGQGRGGLYWISYFREGGVQVVEVEEQATERGGPAKAIAKLGEDGWEMVGQGPLEIRQGGFNALYFKRPKP